MEREACVCNHGYERSDLCAEIIIIISFLHVPPVIKLFLSRRSRIPYSYVATCRIFTKEREHASQSKRRRPQYGNHSTNLPFGNDEHTFYIRLY